MPMCRNKTASQVILFRHDHRVFEVNDICWPRDQGCESSVTSFLTNIKCVTSPLLQIDQRRADQNWTTNAENGYRMEIIKYLVFVAVVHLSSFNSHADVTSVKVSEFRRSAVLVFIEVCCLVAWCMTEACFTRGYVRVPSLVR